MSDELSSVSSSHVDQNVPDSSEIFIPRGTKKKKAKHVHPLKRKATGPSSGVSTRKLNNLSLNTSIVKQTLRANNRSLARALEMAHQEYNVLQQHYVELQASTIDNQRRMKKRLTDLRLLLDTVSLKLVNSVSLLEEAQTLCDVDQDLNATTVTPVFTIQVPQITAVLPPRASPQRIVAVPTAAEPVLNMAKADMLTVPVDEAEDQQPPELVAHDSRTDCLQAETEDPGVVSDIIERMRADITHTVSSIQGWKADPVSLAPLDVSVIMEQSYLMEQLPSFESNDHGSSRKAQRKAHSRSNSGRRSVMLYKAAPLDLEGGYEETEEWGPQRSLRARSRSRHGGRKTLPEEVESASESQIKGRTSNVNENNLPRTLIDNVFGPQTEANVFFAANKIPRTPTVPAPHVSMVDHSDLLPQPSKINFKETTEAEIVDSTEPFEEAHQKGKPNVFRPRKEIPRTPPSHRTSAVELLPAPEQNDSEQNIIPPRFIPLKVSIPSKCKPNKRKQSSVQSKNTEATTTQDKKDKKAVVTRASLARTSIKYCSVSTGVKRSSSGDVTGEAKSSTTECEAVESGNGRESAMEETIIASTVKADENNLHLKVGHSDGNAKTEITTTSEMKSVEDHSMKHVAKSSVQICNENNATGEVSPLSKVTPKEVGETMDTIQKVVLEDNSDQELTRSSHLRRGTFHIPKGYYTEDLTEDSITDDEVFDNGVATELSIPAPRKQRRGTFCVPISEPEVVAVPKGDHCRNNSKPKKSDLPEKSGACTLGIASADSEIAFDLDEGEHDMLNEHDITLVDDLEDTIVCVPSATVTGTNDETKYEDEDMELTEIFNIPVSIPISEDKVSGDKIPVPSFIRKSQGQLSVDDLPEEIHKEKKPLKKIAVQKMRKKEKKDTLCDSKNKPSGASSEATVYMENTSESSKAIKKVEEPVVSNNPKANRGDTFKKPAIKSLRPVPKVKPALEKKEKPLPKKYDDSESDKDGTKFQAMMEKPGKIVFKAGRKNIDELKSKVQKNGKVQSKVKSLLACPDKPRSKKARSKSRLLSIQHDLKLGLEPKSTTGPKSVFDMSLNESITVLPQMSYGDFREHNPQMEAMKCALKSNQNAETTDVSPHGIMLVMGNGKRTKPRRRAKSVTYARKLKEVHVRSPSSSSESSPTTRRTRKFAGSTPPRSKSATEEPQSSQEKSNSVEGHLTTIQIDTAVEDGEKEDSLLVPDTPELSFKKKPKKFQKEITDEPVACSLKLNSVDSVRESICSISSATDEPVPNKSLPPPGSQTAVKETKSAKAKKRQSQVRPSVGCGKRHSLTTPGSPPSNSVRKSPKSGASSKTSVGRKSRESIASRENLTDITKRSLPLHEDFKIPQDTEVIPKRPRRGASQISYKEPTLNAKLRRGDPISSSLYKEDHTMNTTKTRKSEKRSRSVLHTITNVAMDV